MPFIFDGVNKIIIEPNGASATIIDAASVYSEWKQWALNNPMFPPAFRTLGGDDIGGGQKISGYFFLINNWRIRPYEGNHMVSVLGNLSVDGGGNPFIPTVGNYLVSTQIITSANSLTVSTGSALTPEEHARLFKTATKGDVYGAN